MVMRIYTLEASVANQIAAGEVIERPASVVKELLENALDAQAKNISIEIDFGGLNQIKVSDDGSGILAEDLPLAIAAHATSKIKQLNDLYALSSMGFRGEALASIASISRLSICSKPADQTHAMLLKVHEQINLTAAARSQGTTVEVRDLFFNAPVRKKFLKTPLGEYQAIESVVKRFALSAPDIGLTLKHNDKQMLALPPAFTEHHRVARIQKVLGKAFMDQAIQLEVERAGLQLQGWVSSRTYQRSQNDKQWIYINQRMVKDKLITHSLKQAYEDVLHPGKHPSCLLYLSIPTQEVDVNVHPTKHEVRFQQPRLVHDFVTSQISQALALPTLKQDDDVFIQEESVDYTPASQPWKPLASLNRFSADEHNYSPRYAKNTWHILNPRFALVTLSDEQFYLIDVIRLQQHRHELMLSQATFPLAPRPLLVPVSYTINKIDHSKIEQYRSLLMQVGIQWDFASETHLFIRTIPQCLPMLHIEHLLNDILKSKPLDLTALLQLLIANQTLNNSLDAEEKSVCLTHLEQYIQKVDTCSSHHRDNARSASLSEPYCISLDIENCKRLLS
jgi:DNA mismatch repair protein MutL